MDSNSLLSMNLALNVARKCRICGMDIHDLTCAFPIFGNDRLDTKIERYLQLNIQVDDLLPKCVCGSCYLKLESIDQFAVMANRTEEAFRAWISRLRGLNCPEEAVKSVNLALPIYRRHLEPTSNPVNVKGNIVWQPGTFSAAQSNAPGAPVNVSSGANSYVSYSDLKLGLLIKDQELLKLILKALKWAENDRKASFDVLIQRLKNSSFREVLSNRNLLNDSDLTQLLKSYIGQGVMNSFLSTPAPGGHGFNNNVPPLVPLQPTNAQPNPTNENVVEMNRIKLTAPNLNASGAGTSSGSNLADLKIDDASVTQMEVGVDPDLYLPYEDEDSSSATKFESRMEDRQENTVTIKLVTTNVAGDMVENKRMIPAILNVRGSNRFQCSACPECFATNADLQQHIVTRHLSKANRTVLTKQGKPAIKIRVRKNRHTMIMVPKPMIAPSPRTVIMPAKKSHGPVNSTPMSAPPINSITPLNIPASTTITVVPMAIEEEPFTTSTKQSAKVVSTSPKNPVEEPPPKMELVRKSKRNPSIKQEHNTPEAEKKIQKVKSKDTVAAVPKSTRRTITSFCALCRKKLAPREHIREHMAREHSRYECEKCDRAFKSALTLSRHQQYHATGAAGKSATPNSQKANRAYEQAHKCSFCGRVFKRSNHLKLHLNYHLKDAGNTLVGTSPGGNSLRKRTTLNSAMSIDGNGNISGNRAKKPTSTTRKCALNRKTRLVS